MNSTITFQLHRLRAPLIAFLVTTLVAAQQYPLQAINATDQTINSIPYSTRAHWMRVANKALSQLSSPCPFAAFGTVIVNHTAATPDNIGELVCMGVNENSRTGNPTLHGEMSAIQNCTALFTDQTGNYRMNPSEAQTAFSQLSLYTNAESCPMCASAIRWAEFKEYIYGTSIDTLVQRGWSQIRISSYEVFRQSTDLDGRTSLIAGILTNETDPFFLWQYDPDYPCPIGCERTVDGSSCKVAT